jgi:hypothetical protein
MLRSILLALLLVALAPPAFAGGPVCILQEVGALQFLIVLTKPKIPKGPGVSAPLLGMLDVSPEAPISGTISRGVTGALRAGATIVQQNGIACFVHVTIDETLEGDGTIACSDDPDAESAITWTPTEC